MLNSKKFRLVYAAVFPAGRTRKLIKDISHREHHEAVLIIMIDVDGKLFVEKNVFGEYSNQHISFVDACKLIAKVVKLVQIAAA